MVYTLLCICCTTSLGALFKWAEQYQVRHSAIIPINYFICFFIGFLHTGYSITAELSTEWLFYAIGLGCLFVIGFSSYAKSIQLAGLPIATLFQKISIILTVSMAILLGDSLNTVQIIGMFLGLASLYFILNIHDSEKRVRYKYLGFLMITFFVASGIEIIFIIINKTFQFSTTLKLIFSSYIFLVAGILGLLAFFFMIKSIHITKNELAFGICLGIPNFYSIYFLMMALDHEMNASIFFPLLNCSVIMLSTILGKYLFKETLNRNQIIGIVLAMISIFVIYTFKN
jgi:drug/metabolite transporter (DMT)-like permease